MQNGSWQDYGFPRTSQLTAEATIVPQPRTASWFNKFVRHRERDGTVVWDSEENRREDLVFDDGLHYDPNAPGCYYVMPEMYVPTEREEQQVYNVGKNAVYETEQYHDQFYTDVRIVNTTSGEGKYNLNLKK